MVGDWAPKWRKLYPFWGSVDDIVKKGPVGREFVPKLDQIFHTGDATKILQMHALTVVQYVQYMYSYMYTGGELHIHRRRNDFLYTNPRGVFEASKLHANLKKKIIKLAISKILCPVLGLLKYL